MPRQLTHTFPWKRLSQFKVKIKDASTVAKPHLKPQPLLLPKVFEIAGFVTFYKNQKKRDFLEECRHGKTGSHSDYLALVGNCFPVSDDTDRIPVRLCMQDTIIITDKILTSSYRNHQKKTKQEPCIS